MSALEGKNGRRFDQDIKKCHVFSIPVTYKLIISEVLKQFYIP